MTTTGRLAGPDFVAHTWPETVEPLRAVHSSGRTIPRPRSSKSYSRTSPAQALPPTAHTVPGLRSGSAASVVASDCAFSCSRLSSSAWYSGVWCSAARSPLLARFFSSFSDDEPCAPASATPSARAASTTAIDPSRLMPAASRATSERRSA